MRMGGPVGLGGGGIGTILIVLLISWFTGVNPLSLLQMTGGPSEAPAESVPTGSVGNDPQAKFIGAVLGDMEETWTEIFAKAGPTLSATRAGAVQRRRPVGVRLSVIGNGPVLLSRPTEGLPRPFVLPRARQNFGAPGDFAQAYVVAHEVGHHVQNVLGVNQQVARLQQQASKARGQQPVGAARTAGGLLRRRVGTLRRAAGHARSGRRGRRPEAPPPRSATIGCSDSLRGGCRRRASRTAHRNSAAYWLRQGLSSGSIEQCDTFKAGSR